MADLLHSKPMTGQLLAGGTFAALLLTLAVATAAAQPAAELPAAPHPVVRVGMGSSLLPQSYAGIPIARASQQSLPLTLDDAIEHGTRENLQVKLAAETERSVRGQILGVFFNLLPNMRATAFTSAKQINLAAMGFKPSSLVAFGIDPATFSTIVKVDTTGAQLSADQVLFNLPDIYLYTAARKAAEVVNMNSLNIQGGIVDAVGTQYLAALADQAQIANAQALVKADQEELRQATLAHDAGVGTHLDVLRAQVQLQSEQETLVQDQNLFAKDKIALNRLMGLPAEQEITLTDTVPYNELVELPLDQAMQLAFQHRKDLLELQDELQVAERAKKAAKFERLPSVSFNGYYGVLGETHGLYHGVFTAQGVLKIPIFEEARFRGEEATTSAQQISLQHQIESLRVTIEQQIRSAMLDVESSGQLVKVAQSNVALATQELSDTRDRFAAGVTDNLPVVQAQAQLAAAQSRLIATQFQYNVAKLTLARNTGVVESQYKHYLGRE